MKISVIGMGYVGLVAASVFAASGHQVIGIEKDFGKVSLLQQGICPIYESGLDEMLKKALDRVLISFSSEIKRVNDSDIIFIAVGTPSTADGRIDLGQVYEVLEKLVEVIEKPITLVMKSTVAPGTGENLKQRFLSKAKVPINYVSNPEFLREGKALWDWTHPDRIVIGADDRQAADQVASLFSENLASIIVTSVTSAEMIKYAANAFLATKVSFINEIANLCELVGADIDEVAKAVGMDKRIGEQFLQAGIGYGGSCFPKDTKALYHLSSFNGYNFSLLKAVIEVNSRQRIEAVRKLKQALGMLAEQRVAVLGLAFKPETDDIREAPALDIIQMLLSEGAKVLVYDPLAVKKAQKVLPSNVVFADDAYDCIHNCNAICVTTEWSEFVTLDWLRVKDMMLEPYVILDGRNVLDKEELTGIGFCYLGVGR